MGGLTRRALCSGASLAVLKAGALAAALAVPVALQPAPGAGQRIAPQRPATQQVLPTTLLERLQEGVAGSRPQGGWMARTAHALDTGEALTGTLPVAVILALFSDSPEPHITSEEVQRALFDGPSPYGTVSEYYQEVSSGRFGVSGQVTPWFRTSLPMAEVVGSEWGLGEDAKTGTYLFEAVSAADFALDFSLFDNDGPDGVPNSGDDDGVVDAVAIQFLEVSASCGGPAIWPHRSGLQYWGDGEPFVTNDPAANGGFIVVNDYTTQGATDCGGVEVQNASTISHELGHVLGLPDLYDRSRGLTPGDRRWVVGCWSLMAAGSWGCGTDERVEWVRPTHLGPWEKEVLGWLPNLEVVEPALDRLYVLKPVRNGGKVLKVELEPGTAKPTSEYLLVEYRTREGFDEDLPASGVMVYHVDPKLAGNQPCDTCTQIYRVGVLEADGNNSLRRTFGEGGNRGEAGDAWGVTGPGSLTNSTYPSTRLQSGAPSPVTFYRIAIEGGEAHVTLSSREVPRESLLQTFLKSAAAPLTAEERGYLDTHGNGNGQYDVGDLRAYLKR